MAPPFGFTRAGSSPASFNHAKRLRRERFIQFDHVDLIERQPRDLQRLRNREHRPDAHFFRRASSRGKRHESREWFQTEGASAFSALITTAAAAPSLICELFPAVTTPCT